MLTLEDVGVEKPAEIVSPEVGDERMVCRFRAGLWRWTWHDQRGRMLLAGPESIDKWEAHRLFLSAIQDACSQGELAPMDDGMEYQRRQTAEPVMGFGGRFYRRYGHLSLRVTDYRR